MRAARQQFSRSLEAIGEKVSDLFSMIAEDLPHAAQALLGGPGEAGRLLSGREQVIDALYLEIEELASREILLQAPVACDLRFLLSVLRVTPELERSHDLVMLVAAQPGLASGQNLTPRGQALTGQMGELACQMWHQAAGAWHQRDPAAAPALAARDQEMRQLHASLSAELASGRMTAPVTMEMAIVARCYQRLSAHALNVARRIAYLTGPAAG